MLQVVLRVVLQVVLQVVLVLEVLEVLLLLVLLVVVLLLLLLLLLLAHVVHLVGVVVERAVRHARLEVDARHQAVVLLVVLPQPAGPVYKGLCQQPVAPPPPPAVLVGLVWLGGHVGRPHSFIAPLLPLD